MTRSSAAEAPAAPAQTGDEEPQAKRRRDVSFVAGSRGRLRILQATDLHIMDIDRGFRGTGVPEAWRASLGDTSVCMRRTLDLVKRALETQEINVVVLTGDIIDARGQPTIDLFLELFRPLAELISAHGAVWLYIPGNHEDGHDEEYTREDVARIFELPGSLRLPGDCSFDQTFLLTIADGNGAAVLLQLLDARWTKKTCYITPAQVEKARLELERTCPQSDGDTRPTAKFSFVHEPFDCYADTSSVPIARGVWSYNPRQNMEDSGYLDLLHEKAFHGLFVGHNHHNDFVRWVEGSDGPWLGHGRCGSFFPPSSWEGTYPLPFDRGARVFEVDAIRARIATWIYEDGAGVDASSLLERPL